MAKATRPGRDHREDRSEGLGHGTPHGAPFRQQAAFCHLPRGLGVGGSQWAASASVVSPPPTERGTTVPLLPPHVCLEPAREPCCALPEMLRSCRDCFGSKVLRMQPRW